MQLIRRILIFSFLLVVALDAQVRESLLIGPGDLVHVAVFDTPELEQHGRVSDAGLLSLTIGGDVKVAGLTPSDAGRVVEHALIQGHYLRSPRVSITIEDYATQKVSILGEVKAPGAYTIVTPRLILDVLTLGGGLTDLADRKLVIKRRATSESITYFVSNLSAVALNTEVQVYPGDTVLVPKAGLVYVLGDVRLPGGYTMTNNEGQLTVLQLVSRAGGVNSTALASRARIIHKSVSGAVEQPLPLSAMLKGEQPDIFLQPNDVIYVPFSYFKNVVGASTGNIASSLASAAVYRF